MFSYIKTTSYLLLSFQKIRIFSELLQRSMHNRAYTESVWSTDIKIWVCRNFKTFVARVRSCILRFVHFALKIFRGKKKTNITTAFFGAENPKCCFSLKSGLFELPRANEMPSLLLKYMSILVEYIQLNKGIKYMHLAFFSDASAVL